MTAKQLNELRILNERINAAKRDGEQLAGLISMAKQTIEGNWLTNSTERIWNDLLKLIYPKHGGYFEYEVLDKKTLLQILQIAYEYNDSRLKQLQNEFESITIKK